MGGRKKLTQKQHNTMNKLILVALLAVLGHVMAQSHIVIPQRANSKGVPMPLTEVEYQTLFNKFVHKYERMYATKDESDKRFVIFKKNVEKARFYNYMINDNVYGVTKFSDMNEEEFKGRYLMKQTITPSQARAQLQGASVATVTKEQVVNAPDNVNWVDQGAVTPVKNQGACGSCWAFSTTGNVEGQWFLKTKQLVSLSEQNLVDCDHTCDPKDKSTCDGGCNGGLMWLAYQYIINNGGIDTEDSYPYEGIDDTCRFKNSTVGAKVTGWEMLPTDEDKLAAWLATNGPVSVAINAEWLQFYFGGISDPMWCNPENLDHGVLIVGYGVGKTWLGAEKPYWLVKNSWGSSWGEAGYFKIARGGNKCGIASVPCSSKV